MEVEQIATHYGALPTDVMAAPASLIRHYRLMSRLWADEHAQFADDGSDE